MREPPSDGKMVDSMSQSLLIKFDGPELRAHEMDVTLLAPSLLAFGELCKEANLVLNGERAKVKVLLHADVNANCVQVQLSVVQSLWDTVTALVRQPNVATAKEILEWLGYITGGITGGVMFTVGLVQFLLWKRNRKEESAEITSSSNGNTVTIRVQGDNNTVTIPEPVYKLSKNVKVVENLKTVTNPVSESYGITEASFIYQKTPQLTIDPESARSLREATADTDTVEPQIFTAHIVVHGVTLDAKSKKWKFKLNNKIESVDIGESTIASDAMVRGGVFVGDTYKAKMEMIERKTASGAYVTDYKVKEVLEFIPGRRAEQVLLFPPAERGPDNEKCQ
jgi:acyl-CoA synthetase (AMP-forming)/AMP-acid ligase II